MKLLKKIVFNIEILETRVLIALRLYNNVITSYILDIAMHSI